MLNEVEEEYFSRKKYGYTNNKDIRISKVDAIEINKFRNLHERKLELGNYLTIISGKNGTMKTTLMGLIAHPFSNDKEDAFHIPLKTKLGDVFKLSKKYDDEYNYNICFTTNKNEKIKEKVNIDVVSDRHRIVVSGHGKGDGNFLFNSSFLNLGRLNPIVETNAIEKQDIVLSEEELKELIRFYSCVFVSADNDEFTAVSDDKKKSTFGPTGKNATYDFNSISSGEDNIGSIFNKLVSFERAKSGGILCIDEIEASLHPSAQINIINYLIKWAKKFNVQIVLTTHSLHIIQTLYLKNKEELDNKNIVIDFISFSQAKNDKNYNIIPNPEYSLAYKELTLSTPEEISKKYKATVYCEDEMAKHMIKSLLGRKLCELVNIEHNLDNNDSNNGTSKTSLTSLCKNFSTIMQQTNAFVIYDPDINESDVQNIKEKCLYMKLPDPENFAIERRVLIYLISLQPNDPFFDKNNILQESIKNDLVQNCRIIPATENTLKSTDIKNCKKWVNNNKILFKKSITKYCKSFSNETKNGFKMNFISCLNESNAKLGIPKIKNFG